MNFSDNYLVHGLDSLKIAAKYFVWNRVRYEDGVAPEDREHVVLDESLPTSPPITSFFGNFFEEDRSENPDNILEHTRLSDFNEEITFFKRLINQNAFKIDSFQH